MKQLLKLYLSCFLLIAVAACAAPVSRFKAEAEMAVEMVRASGMEALFPFEAEDIYSTVILGDLELAKSEIPQADAYYNLALGKAEILETLYVKELKAREERARLEIEQKRQAEAEALEQRKIQEREKAAGIAREAAARARQLETERAERAERAEIRRKAERTRQEKELPIVLRHTVKRGQTLPQIAAMQEIYGEAALWPLIYRANRDQIGNPAVLWPGQVLRIPRNSDKNDIAEARRFAAERSLR